jgi:hypothetical protein
LPALFVSSVARDAPEVALPEDAPFLQKPYLPGTLLTAVRGVLSSTGRSSASV